MTTRSPDVIEEFLDEAQFELKHEAQRRSFAWYLTGLLGPLERKSVEPIAALLDPEHIKKTPGHSPALPCLRDMEGRTPSGPRHTLRSSARGASHQRGARRHPRHELVSEGQTEDE